MRLATTGADLDPSRYPWHPAPWSGLLSDDGFHPTSPESLDRALAAVGCAPVASRTVVVAVGSNGSPDVLARKLAAADVGVTVPLLSCTVGGLGIGHSAHISPAGYIAAAPYDDPDATTPTVAALLEPAQVAALDVTEPNYRRVLLDTGRYPLALDFGEGPATYSVYRSTHGVLALDSRIVPAQPQSDLFALLASRPGLVDVEPERRFPGGVVSPTERGRVREAWAASGMAIDGGLDPLAADTAQ